MVTAVIICKEYPFSIHIEILLILILFSTAVREIEDLIHNRKVFLKVINKDCLDFINKIVSWLLSSGETKRTVLNISIAVNKIYNEWVTCSVFFTPMVT